MRANGDTVYMLALTFVCKSRETGRERERETEREREGEREDRE
jgi:hypothetical protein